MPFPCHLRHVLEIDAPGLPQGLAKPAMVEGDTFRFSTQVQQRAGLVSISFDLLVLADHVTAANFEHHKAKVRAVWPHLLVDAVLPAGRTVPWGAHTPRNLLRRKVARTSANTAPAQPPQTETTLQGGPAPTEPAPALAPAPTRAAPAREKGTVTPRQAQSMRRADAATGRERAVERRPNPTAGRRDSSTGGAATARRGARRRARRRRRLIGWIGAAMGALLVLVLIIFLLHRA
jgi:hypothetical protein